MSPAEASLNGQRVGKKTYPCLFAALAVFQRQRRESHQEWRCIVALELNDSKQLDDA